MSDHDHEEPETKEGIELILATKPFAQDNPVRSWWVILSTALLILATLAGTVWNLNLGLQLVCSVVAGLLMTRFFVIYHDQQHYAILPRSKLAEGLMRIYGILALSPSSVWRSSHNHQLVEWDVEVLQLQLMELFFYIILLVKVQLLVSEVYTMKEEQQHTKSVIG